MSTIKSYKQFNLAGLGSQYFVVPKYQRSYSWTGKNFSELWDDIRTIILQENREHFLGTLIFCPYEEKDNINKLQVVDGQQRLATLIILLRVLYDSMIEDKDTKKEAEKYIYRGYIRDSENNPYFLELSELDDEFFKKFILEKKRPYSEKKGKRKSYKNIKEAYNFFVGKIKEESARKKLKPSAYSEEVFDKIGKKLVFVSIEVASEVDAYTIFESINSKREDLTLSDLLKNYIFSSAQKINNSRLKEVQRDWNSMSNILLESKGSISDFIRHYWISNYGKVYEKDLYRTIKNEFKNNDGEIELERIVSFMFNLSNEVDDYKKIIDPSSYFGVEEVILDYLITLNTLNSRQFYPVVLSVLRIGEKTESLRNLLSCICSLSVRRSVLGKNPNELENFYSQKAPLLRKSEISVEQFIIDMKKEFFINNDEILDDIKDNAIGNILAKIILINLEKSISTNEKLLGKFSLEHIAPQKPKTVKEWGMKSKDEYEKYVNKIGNLTLILPKFNREVSNKNFSEKKIIYKESNIIINQDIINCKKWDKKAIDKRTEKISEFFISNWGIEKVNK